VPFPPFLLQFAGKILGRSEQIARLMQSLKVDSDKIRRDLGWVPPFTVRQGLEITASDYRTSSVIK
jgi:nucleoside-diphosphate-sugar epimerase